MSAAGAPRPEADPRTRRLLAAILIVAALLRFAGANREPWYDEIASLDEVVRLPVAEIVTRWAPLNHVLNSVLAHAAIGLLGERPWALRLPAILFGVAGVWAFHLVARRLWSPPVALLGTFLFALSPHHVHYSQDARGYTALVFFVLVATALLLDELRGDGARHIGPAYALAIGLGLYAQLIMLPVAVAHGVLLVALRRRRLLGWLLAGFGLALVLYFPMYGKEMARYRESMMRGLLGPRRGEMSWNVVPFARELRPFAPLLAVGAIVGAFGLGRLAVRDPQAGAVLALPVAASVVINVVVPLRAWQGEGVHPRYLMLALPIGYLCLVEALDWLLRRARGVATASAAVAAMLSLAAIARAYPLPKQGYQTALAWVAAHRTAGEAFVGIAAGGRAAKFYDQSLVVVMDREDLDAWLQRTPAPAWVLFTFPNQLALDAPELRAWIDASTVPRAAFPGTIGDGDVRVHYWPRP